MSVVISSSHIIVPVFIFKTGFVDGVGITLGAFFRFGPVGVFIGSGGPS